MQLKPFQSKLTQAFPRTLELEHDAALAEVERYNDSHSHKRLARVNRIIADRADEVLTWLREAHALALRKAATLRATGNTDAADGWQRFAGLKAARIAEVESLLKPAVLAAFEEATAGATEADRQALAGEPYMLADFTSDRIAA